MSRAWIQRIAAATVFSGLIATGIAFLAPRSAAAEEANAKNLKVLPANMPRAEVKKLMKKVATSLGVQCEHCHDTDDFSKDTEKKDIARGMMKMTGAINKEFFKGEMRVGCVTCHNGAKEPKKPL